MLEKIEGQKRRGRQKTRQLDGILNAHEFQQAPEVGDGQGQGSLVRCFTINYDVSYTVYYHHQVEEVFYFQFAKSFYTECPHSLRSVQIFVTPWSLSPNGSSGLEDSTGKNIGVGCHALYQGIFPTMEQILDFIKLFFSVFRDGLFFVLQYFELH